MRVKYMKVKDAERFNLNQFPNFSARGSVRGMKDLYYGKGALLVKSGGWIYNVTDKPDIYYNHAY